MSMNEEKIARALGWFSLGLGLTELMATRSLSEYLGMEEQTALIRAYGLREIASGIGILSHPHPTTGVWARAGGDMMDLLTLGTAYTPDNLKRANVGIALGTVAAVTLVDLLCAQKLSKSTPVEPAPESNRVNGKGYG